MKLLKLFSIFFATMLSFYTYADDELPPACSAAIQSFRSSIREADALFQTNKYEKKLNAALETHKSPIASMLRPVAPYGFVTLTEITILTHEILQILQGICSDMSLSDQAELKKDFLYRGATDRLRNFQLKSCTVSKGPSQLKDGDLVLEVGQYILYCSAAIDALLLDFYKAGAYDGGAVSAGTICRGGRGARSVASGGGTLFDPDDEVSTIWTKVVATIKKGALETKQLAKKARSPQSKLRSQRLEYQRLARIKYEQIARTKQDEQKAATLALLEAEERQRELDRQEAATLALLEAEERQRELDRQEAATLALLEAERLAMGSAAYARADAHGRDFVFASSIKPADRTILERFTTTLHITDRAADAHKNDARVPGWIAKTMEVMQYCTNGQKPLLTMEVATQTLIDHSRHTKFKPEHYTSMEKLLAARITGGDSRLFCTAVTLAHNDPSKMTQLQILLDTTNNSASAINNGLLVLAGGILLENY